MLGMTGMLGMTAMWARDDAGGEGKRLGKPAD
jgi:hypothetical protein